MPVPLCVANSAKFSLGQLCPLLCYFDCVCFGAKAFGKAKVATVFGLCAGKDNPVAFAKFADLDVAGDFDFFGHDLFLSSNRLIGVNEL
jgi:hypothetical protein